jgi:hypothetical protein
MKEDKPKEIGGFLGNVLGGLTGATVPVIAGVLKSTLTTDFLELLIRALPDILDPIFSAVASVDLRKIFPSISLATVINRAVWMTLSLLDPLIELLDPLLDALFDVLHPVVEVVEPLLEGIGEIMESLDRMLKPLYEAFYKVYHLEWA